MRKPIAGFPYEASDDGRIFSHHVGRFMKPGMTRNGYLFVVLCNGIGDRRQARVHRLIAETFLGPAPAGREVNHKNGCKADNRVANLEWVTSSQNRLHAFSLGHGGPPPPQLGEAAPLAKLTAAKVREIRRRRKAGERILSIARRFGITDGNVSHVCNRKTWKHIPEKS